MRNRYIQMRIRATHSLTLKKLLLFYIFSSLKHQTLIIFRFFCSLMRYFIKTTEVNYDFDENING